MAPKLVAPEFPTAAVGQPNQEITHKLVDRRVRVVGALRLSVGDERLSTFRASIETPCRVDRTASPEVRMARERSRRNERDAQDSSAIHLLKLFGTNPSKFCTSESRAEQGSPVCSDDVDWILWRITPAHEDAIG